MAASDSFGGGFDEDPRAGTGLERIRYRVPLSERDELRIASGVMFLCSHSRLHAIYPADMLDRRIGPSLRRRQFHYYTDHSGVPLAFCNWVWLNKTVLDDVLATGRDLEAREFECGDLPFFYEFLAPFGHCRAVVRDLRALAFFKGRCIPAIRGDLDDGRRPFMPRVRYFHF